MIWLLVLAGVAILVVLIAHSNSRGVQSRSAPPLPLVLPAPRATPAPACMAVVSSSAPATPANALQPYSPIPLLIVGAAGDAIAALRVILEDERCYGRDRQEKILSWLVTTNARIAEVDAFIGKWAPRFANKVKELCESDPDWASAGELDRGDIRAGAGQKAFEQMEVRVRDLDYEVLAEPAKLAATADDALLARYGFQALSFYFRNADNLARIHTAPSDDWYRPRFNDLVAKGLAKRGNDVSPDAILQVLTLKDMEAVATGVEHKRFTRRAPAIEFLSGLPDLRERLGRHVSFRELFQLQPLPEEFSSLDRAALGHAWAFAAEYAKLIDQTYSTAASAHRAVTDAANDEYAKGWVVEAGYGDDSCCPYCAQQSGAQRGRTAPRVPHHVGCSCHVNQIYE